MEPLTIDLESAPPPECGITRQTLRRLQAGEFSDDKRKDLLTHTEGCLDCQTVLAELRSDEAAFRTHIPWDKFVLGHEKKKAALEAAVPGRKLWNWLTGGLTVGLLGAAAAFVMMPVVDEGSRIKGGDVDVNFLVRTGEGVRAGRSGEALHEGDQIQLLVKGPAQGMAVVVVEIDGKGEVSVVHAGPAPVNGVQAPAPLPDSLVLDDAVGPDRFFALYVPAGDVEKVRAEAVEAARKIADQKADLTTMERLPLDGVKQDSVLIVKVPR